MGATPTIEQTPGRLDITLVRGDDLRLVLTFKNRDGSAINLTGYTIVATSRDVPLTVSIIDAAGGKLALSLTDTQTGEMKPGQQRPWFLRWTTPSAQTLTVMNGLLTVKSEAPT